MSHGIEVRHIKNLDEFEALRESWGALVSHREIKTVFLTWEWLYAWWKTYQKEKELWLITAWENNELVGIAPLTLSPARKHGLRFRLLQSLGELNTDESDFLVKNNSPEILQALWGYILQHKNQWDAIMLHEFRTSLTSTQVLQDIISKANLVTRIKHNLHYHIPITGLWEAYFKSLSKNMRQNLERRLRRTRESYNMVFEHHKGNDIEWEHFETIFAINKNGAFPEKYESVSERTFHKELFTQMKSRNWMEIVIVTLDDEPAAFEYGFNMDGRFEDWRTGYNYKFSKQAIAKSLLYLLLQDLFVHGYNDFDFLRGEYDHKNDWLPSNHDFIGFTIVKSLHIPARLALITIPLIWQWTKEHILPVIIKYRKRQTL